VNGAVVGATAHRPARSGMGRSDANEEPPGLPKMDAPHGAGPPYRMATLRKGDTMQAKPLFAALVAAAFAFPLAATAGGTDKTSGAKSAPANGSNDGGAEAMFKAMDKNGDGSISKEEAAGTPHAANFATLDKDGDGKLSRAEHAAAPEHAGAQSKDASTSGTTTSSSGSDSGQKKTY
jgi:hypothetical protein